MINDERVKINCNGDIIELDDRTIFFNELKRVCKDFGFLGVEYQLERECMVYESVYKLKESENLNLKERIKNLDNIIDYMLKFSDENGLMDIMMESNFTYF